jgi:hypothetical protein
MRSIIWTVCAREATFRGLAIAADRLIRYAALVKHGHEQVTSVRLRNCFDCQIANGVSTSVQQRRRREQ